MTFTPQFLDEIRARVPRSDVIGRRVRLIRKGREHSALCPFHNEKTPSFTVSDNKGFFHCFGCGVGGDVFKFLELHGKLGFQESVRLLASRFGLPVPEIEMDAGKAAADAELSLIHI